MFYKMERVVPLYNSDINKIKEILNSAETTRHECGCLQLNEFMLKMDTCNYHQLRPENVFSLFMDLNNASNLRLYTILGIILS